MASVCSRNCPGAEGAAEPSATLTPVHNGSSAQLASVLPGEGLRWFGRQCGIQESSEGEDSQLMAGTVRMKRKGWV